MAKMEMNLFKAFKEDDPNNHDQVSLVIIGSIIIGATVLGILSLFFFFPKVMFIILFLISIVGLAGYGTMILINHWINISNEKDKNNRQE